MIRIDIQERNGWIERIRVRGHAESGPYGQDLVCAGVSCIVTGGQNALHALFPDAAKFVSRPGYSDIQVIQNGAGLQPVLEFLIVQLATVQEQFPEFVKLNRKEV